MEADLKKRIVNRILGKVPKGYVISPNNEWQWVETPMGVEVTFECKNWQMGKMMLFFMWDYKKEISNGR